MITKANYWAKDRLYTRSPSIYSVTYHPSLSTRRRVKDPDFLMLWTVSCLHFVERQTSEQNTRARLGVHANSIATSIVASHPPPQPPVLLSLSVYGAYIPLYRLFLDTVKKVRLFLSGLRCRTPSSPSTKYKYKFRNYLSCFWWHVYLDCLPNEPIQRNLLSGPLSFGKMSWRIKMCSPVFRGTDVVWWIVISICSIIRKHQGVVERQSCWPVDCVTVERVTQLNPFRRRWHSNGK